MTVKELSMLRGLMKEIKRDYAKLDEINARATSCSSNISGIPNKQSITDKVGKYSSEIADLQDTIKEKLKQSCEELKRLTEFINSVDDPVMRIILSLRFVDGLTWRQVAQKLGIYTEDSVRLVCKRFLDKN